MGKKNKSSSKGNSSSSDVQPEVIPDEFKKVISDFISDISTTFPEYLEKLEKNFTTTTTEKDGTVLIDRTISDEKMIELYEYSKKVYPSRFFDILYKNNDVFKQENKNELIDTHFLPGIEFRDIWNTPDISDNTRETIWKYLQQTIHETDYLNKINNLFVVKPFNDYLFLCTFILYSEDLDDKIDMRFKLISSIIELNKYFQTLLTSKKYIWNGKNVVDCVNLFNKLKINEQYARCRNELKKI